MMQGDEPHEGVPSTLEGTETLALKIDAAVQRITAEATMGRALVCPFLCLLPTVSKL